MSKHDIYDKGNETQWAELMTCEAMRLNDALKFLNEDFPIRSLQEVLCETVGYFLNGKWEEVTIEEARKVLLNKIGSDFEQKINSWLPINNEDNIKKQVVSIKIESLMQIAFALNMTLDDVDVLLRRCWLDSLYLRDVRDIIYKCGLKCRFSYNEVEKLIEEFSYLNKPNPFPDAEDEHDGDNLTNILSDDFDKRNITTPDDLRSYIKENDKLLGSYRRRVHKKLIELYTQIKTGIEDEFYASDIVERDAEEWFEHDDYDDSSDVDKEEMKIGVKQIIAQDDILKMLGSGIHELKDKINNKGIGDGLSAIIRKHIIDNIPGRSEWSGIINQRVDKKSGSIRGVDRKLLVLIWLSSYDGSLDGDPDAGVDGGFLGFAARAGITPEQALENHIITLNDTILIEYGFPPLDPRHPFDWVIMNTLYLAHILHKGEDNTDIPIRMENLFKQL